MFRPQSRSFAAFILVMVITGCTVHPAGERDERRAASRAGKPFEKPIESRPLPQLPANPTYDQIVQYALLCNADLESRYWEWRSAIEQIPQDGSQTTTFNIAAGTTLTRGRASLGSSTISLANDPMTDIKWPGKLDAAAKQSLENARAAGLRFRKAQFALRAKILNACYDYALNVQLIHQEQQNQQLLQVVLSAAQFRSRSGSASQQDVLKASNDLDLSTSNIASMQSQLPSQLAAINAILNRPFDAPIAIPTDLPKIDSLPYSDDVLLKLAAEQNPEIQALAEEVKGRKDAIKLAKLQYVPDFNLSAGTDLMGISQSLLGQATIPIFRYEALNAAIAQAEDNLKAAEALRRQTVGDLNAEIVMDIATWHDTARQLDLFDGKILPRLRQAVELTRAGYESGQLTLLDLLGSEQSVIATQRLIANLRITQAKTLGDIEAMAARPLVIKADMQ